MPWVKLDDSFPDHPKVAEISDAAFRGYITSLCYASRFLTDGFVPSAMAKRFAPAKVINELIERALWEPTELGIRIHDYLQYNPDRESILAKRAADSARKAGGKNQESRGSPTVPSSSPPDPVVPRTD